MKKILVKKLGVLELANHARTDTNHFWVRQAPVVVVVRWQQDKNVMKDGRIRTGHYHSFFYLQIQLQEVPFLTSLIFVFIYYVP